MLRRDLLDLQDRPVVQAIAAPVLGIPKLSNPVRLSEVLDQDNTAVIETFSGQEVIDCDLNYEAVYGKGQRPLVDQRPHVKQLTALHHLVITQGQPPYLNLAVYGATLQCQYILAYMYNSTSRI